MRNKIPLWLLIFGATLSISSSLFAAKPNIVILLVDDLGWTDLGCFGSDVHETPNLDQLAADGMKFTDGYAACTVCSPTRASILTGKYPPKHGVTNWISGNQRMALEEVTIAEALKAHGYKTAFIGKWHLAPRLAKNVADFYPEHQGFDINIAGNHWGAPGDYYYPFSKGGRVIKVPDAKEGDYLTDVLTDHAVRIISESSKADEQLLLYVSYYNVHSPVIGRKELIAHYQEKLAKHKGQKPRHSNAAYAAMVTSVDESVGRILGTLKTNGMSDNTVVFFTGDNGGVAKRVPGGLNRPLRAGKGSEYEGGVREPTIVKWPGVTKPGSICDEPMISVDYYPTILEITGAKGDAKQNSQIDGLSIVPLLRDSDARLDRDALYWYYPHAHGGGSKQYAAIRQRDWRLRQSLRTGTVELFNLKDDIGERNDLSKKMPEVTARLKAKLLDWLKQSGAKVLPGSAPKKSRKLSAALDRN